MVSKIGYDNVIWKMMIDENVLSLNNTLDDYVIKQELIDYLLNLPSSHDSIPRIIIKCETTEIDSQIFIYILEYYKKNKHNIEFDLNIIHKNLVNQLQPFSDDNPDSSNTMKRIQYRKYILLIHHTFAINSASLYNKSILKEIYKNLLTQVCCCETCFIKEIHKYKIEKKISESIPMLRLNIEKLKSNILKHDYFIDNIVMKMKDFANLNTRDEKIIKLTEIFNYLLKNKEFIKYHGNGAFENAIKNVITKTELDLIHDDDRDIINDMRKALINIKKILNHD